MYSNRYRGQNQVRPVINWTCYTRHMHLLGYIGTALTITAFLPQTIKTIRTRKTRDLSLPTYVILVIGALVWTIYGLGTHSTPIVIANCVVFLASSVVVALKLAED